MLTARHEAGFTLIELLVGMSIGMVVLLATFGLVDAAMPASQRVTDRVESSQTGRTAMEQVMRDLRSTVCVYRVNGTFLSPFTAGTSNANQVTFFRQVYGAPTGGSTTTPNATDPAKSGTVLPQQVVLAVTNGQLTETVTDPAGNGPFAPVSPADWTWPVANARTKVLASNVRQVPGADNEYFTYYAYASGATPPTGSPPALSLGGGDLAAVDEPRIVKVRAQFLVGPKARTSNGTDHYISLRDEASISLPIDFTSGTTASQGGQCTF